MERAAASAMRRRTASSCSCSVRPSLYSQRLTEEDDGNLLFEVEVSEPSEVGWWVLQWGAEAEVLEPDSLRQELGQTAERLVGVYAGVQQNKQQSGEEKENGE